MSFTSIQESWLVLVGVNRDFRGALAVEDGENFIWVWIGGHDEYDWLIGV